MGEARRKTEEEEESKVSGEEKAALTGSDIMEGVKRLAIFVLIATAIAGATDLQPMKILDMSTSESPQLISGAQPILVNHKIFTITLALDGMSYSATYYESRHLRAGDFIVGDMTAAALDGDKLVIRDDRGKETKARIVRRSRLESSK